MQEERGDFIKMLLSWRNKGRKIRGWYLLRQEDKPLPQEIPVN